ncbi:HNH endonuclease [Streptomyces sp. TRM66268-LWL]|uniref:HNH endonuclease n=1 Tax=Streptomyces polyasparticus TaxID=2767826 RepID=A0ABR7SHT3_9ACTN|nr:HNH endonuclease [Streptomyces polyasparticus]
MRTRCLDCRAFATHAGRCAEHHRAYESGRSVQSHRKRRAAIARGNNAAVRLRRALKRVGHGQCAHCGLSFLASAIDVDHIVALSCGGEDVDGNVQLLCHPCHRAKTRVDMGHTSPPF